MRHRKLIGLLMVSIQVTIGLSAPPQRNNQRSNNPAVCQTENCKEISAYILSGLNPQKDPCNDFYEFTCGRWQRTNPLPQGKRAWSRFNVLDKQVESRLIDILETRNEGNVSRPVALMRKYYRDCMDLATLNRDGIEPIDKILRHLGDWPLLNNNNAATINWQEVDRHYGELMGTYSFFHITGDFMATGSTYKIEIQSGEFPTTHHFPLGDRWKNEEPSRPYLEYFLEIVRNFYRHRNIPFSEEKLLNDIIEVLAFEYLLHQATESVETRRESIKKLQISYNSVLRDNHSKEANINWLQSIMNLLKFVNIQIDENEIINIKEWEYLLRLGPLLDSMPNHVIVNYIHWKFVATTISFTNERMRNLPWEVFDKAASRPPRQIECLHDCQFRPVLFYEYAKKYFSGDAKNNTYQMAKKIQRIAEEEIEKVNWLDEGTKSILLEKIQGMHMLIGYPRWYNDRNFTDYYESLEPRALYIVEMINAIKLSNLISLDKFQKPVKKYEWTIEPIIGSGIYYYHFNKIMFPMALIQAHDCCNDLPRAVQYGFDGFIIGHEIFHGLDPIGMKYDKDGGRLHLPRETSRRYNEKVKCLIDEYDGNTFVGTDPQTGELVSIRTNGTLSKKEDVADTGGIRVAFETYQKQTTQNDLKLPGLSNYSSDQLFFISYASAWCQTATARWWKKTFQSGDYDEGHSPVRIRVNNPLKNYNEFAKAFNCKPSDEMIWRSKCTIFN